jgi:hypothetical protein
VGEICPACLSIRGEIPHGRKHLVMKDGWWARFIIETLPPHLLASIAHADKWQRLIQDPCPLWAYQLAKRSVVLGVGLELGSQYSERFNVLKPVYRLSSY